jgi:hypothetical protein
MEGNISDGVCRSRVLGLLKPHEHVFCLFPRESRLFTAQD